MNRVLMVPVHLDALILEQDRTVASATADFSRLPYTDGTRDYNADVANISEEIVALPFQNETLHLKPGVHLHWALPDALTRAVQTGDGTDFPAVPNRWLVVRSSGAGATWTIDKQWVVESDYLYPAGEGRNAGSVSYPLPGATGDAQRFRYLGRNMPLAAWTRDGSDDEYLDLLTASGYGEPTFAAFYPNCHSVFGFHDDDPASVSGGVRYDLLGWYSNAADDPMGGVVGRFNEQHSDGPATAGGLFAEIETELRWTASVDAASEAAGRMDTLCYSRLTIAAGPGLSTPPPATDADITVTFGNTGTEALSARLARDAAGAMNDTLRLQLEDQLEAIHLASRLEGRQLDVGPKFEEARHAKGFTGVSSGSRWTVRPDAGAEPSQAHLQVTLPADVGRRLNELNLLQQSFDCALFEIESVRKRLFADWYKYMLCAYPPEGSTDDYPDIDEVRYFVESHDLAELGGRIAAAGELALAVDDGNGSVTGASSAQAGSRAEQVSAAINGLVAALDAHNSAEASPVPYRLRRVSSARYWKPTEPVALLAGPAVEASPRHGQDGRLRSDGLLECRLLDDASVDELIPADTPRVLAEIDAVESTAGEKIGVATLSAPPWHPLLLEWEVEIYPARDGGNLASDAREYEADYLTRNYELREGEVELTPTSAEVAKAASVYTGRSILTPHAGVQLRKRLADYFERQVLPLYYAAHDGTEASATYFSDHSTAVLDWYKETNCAAGSTDPICGLIDGWQRLTSSEFHTLSQSLGGFNEALLMHKQTLQLDVDEPLGFADYREFTSRVGDAVARRGISAPRPLADFCPIRTGLMRVRRLRLLDTFGQPRDISWSELATSEGLTSPTQADFVELPPRLAQPARIDWRWLSAAAGLEEMNDHPATSPICGWLLPNNLDSSLMVYDQSGAALGLVDQTGRWRPMPGQSAPASIEAIASPHLRKVAAQVAANGAGFVTAFISTLDSALEGIDPESFEQHQGLALLIGRPIAVVRASLHLEIQGLPAVHQGWNAFRRDLGRRRRETDSFTEVEFAIRVGEHRQLNDGLVGYWREEGDGYADDVFYAPAAEGIEHPNIRAHGDEPLNLRQSIDAPPIVLTMLLDPRCAVHATTGLLPTKALTLPPDQYAAALAAIEVNFLSTPILTPQTEVDLPLPTEPGYTWSWVEKDGDSWRETPFSELGTVGTEASFAAGQGLREGWLKLSPQPEDTTTEDES